MALFFVGGALMSNAWLSQAKKSQELGVLGGPEAISPVVDTSYEPVLEATPEVLPGLEDPNIPIDSISEASLTAQSQISLQNKDILANAHIQAGLDESLDSSSPSEKPVLRLKNYFIQPTTGLNWGILHAHNAVDIANVCGTPVVAAASGVVTEVSSDGSWSGGYGNYILLEHSNGTKTKYAHLQSVAVAIGDEVRQGAGIGTIGATGNVHGPTGCHLHFEIYGAVNPFAKK